MLPDAMCVCQELEDCYLRARFALNLGVFLIFLLVLLY